MRDSDRDTEGGGRGETARKRRGKGKVEGETDDRKEGHRHFKESSCHSPVRLLLKTRRSHATTASHFPLLAKFKPPAILTQKKGLIKAYWK